MTSDEYGQLIDDFELGADVGPDETLTQYIERRRREFESKADGGSIGIEVLFGPKRGEYQTGGQAYDSRATAQDYANALQRVSAGKTYQQQADAKRYARNQANQMLTNTMRSGNQANIQNLLQQVGGITSIPGMQFNRSGNRVTSIPSTGAGRDAIVNALANQMLSTTSYGGGSSAPPQKSPLQLKIEENQRIYNEYVKNNPPAIGLITPGQTPTAPKPEYEDQALLSKLTMLTPEEALSGETFDTLSDLDQYNFAQAFTQFQPQLRDPTYVSPYGLDPRQTFGRRYGVKDGGRVGLFMGGPALEGQALSIYNSMNSYGFSDQEIANALAERGLYTSGGTTEETGIIASAPNIINQQTDGDGPSTPPGPTFNRNDLLGTSDYFPNPPLGHSLKMGLGSIVDFIKSGGIIGNTIKAFAKKFQKPRVELVNKINFDAVVREQKRQDAIRDAAFRQAAKDRETYRELEDRITRGEGRGDNEGPSTGATAAGAGMGVGGGYASDYGFLKDGGIAQDAPKGLATMFTRRR